jgi:hypothetical protein
MKIPQVGGLAKLFARKSAAERTMFSMIRVAATILLLLGLIVPAERARAASTSHRAAQPQPGTASDNEIQQTLEKKLAKSKVGKDGFRFHVSHEVVTWEGSTNVMQHKGAATRMARSAGAVQVVNNIQVSATGKTNGTKGLRKAAVEPQK